MLKKAQNCTLTKTKKPSLRGSNLGVNIWSEKWKQVGVRPRLQGRVIQIHRHPFSSGDRNPEVEEEIIKERRNTVRTGIAHSLTKSKRSTGKSKNLESNTKTHRKMGLVTMDFFSLSRDLSFYFILFLMGPSGLVSIYYLLLFGLGQRWPNKIFSDK